MVLEQVKQLDGDPARDFIWNFYDELHRSDFDELEEREKKYNRHLAQIVEASEGLDDFVNRVRNMAESYERVDNRDRNGFEQYVSETVDSVTTYDPETVGRIQDLQNYSWNDINQALNSEASLNDREQMYRNRIAGWSSRLNPEQLSDTLMEHYRREKHFNPGRVEGFETATEKLFEKLGLREYQEALDEVETLPDEDSDLYMQELERIIDDAREEEPGLEKVYSEIEGLLADADSHVELTAFTETRIEYVRKKSPQKARVFEDTVNELYTKALPTEPLH